MPCSQKRTRSLNGNISTRQVNLASLERVPLERNQRMVGSVLRQLDLLGHRVSTSNTGIAGVQLCIVNTLALRPVRSLEAIARKPIITPAGLALGTIRTVPTLLAADIRAG